MRFVVVLVGCAAAVFWLGISNDSVHGTQDPALVAPTDARTPEEERKAFHLPPGFEIELVASEPAIKKPMNIAFDDRGRLWVTETIEYPYPAPEGKPARDGIKILESTKNDGKFDKVTHFTAGLNIPIGILPVTNGVIVHSIPNIYRLSDQDGDDKSDKTDVLYGKIGFVDTHGMTSAFTWGFDGWIYACHGFSNQSELKASDGSTVRMQSGNTYRMKADGSHVEQFTHGQVNPFGLCFDPLGNLYSADCHTRPIMMLLRGGYYQSFGKPHDGLGFAPEMCDHDHGSTAIAGIVYYAADQFPAAYRDTTFIGNVVTNRINHDRLERHGSTYKAIQQPDFLTCDDPWFRPVDIKLGPDGALYVADFYNKIIGHYEVPLTHPGRDRERGRIWRITYKGPESHAEAKPPRADWAKASSKELVADLGNPNLAVRIRAANQLVERKDMSVKDELARASSTTQRAHGLWVLDRQGMLEPARLAAAATDSDRLVRVHAMHVISERGELTEPLRKLAFGGLKDSDAFVQRAAADALGTHPAAEHLAPLLALRHAVPADDTQLLHTVRMALRNQFRDSENWKMLVLQSWSEADLRAIADVAPGLPVPQAADFLLGHLQKVAENQENTLRYVHHIARYGAESTVQQLVDFARNQRPKELLYQAGLLRSIQQGTQEKGSKLTEPALQWGEQVARACLDARDGRTRIAGAELAGLLRIRSLQGQVSSMAKNRQLGEPQRRAMVDALLILNPKEEIPGLGQMLNDPSESIGFREFIIQVLARINRPEGHAELVRALATAPARLQVALAVGLSGNQTAAKLLLDAISSGKASARLLQERAVQERFNRFADLRDQVTNLTKGLPPADERINKLIAARRAGFGKAQANASAGQKDFEKHCAICHQLSNAGAKIGPQLDGIGVRGIDRLLEDMLDPNRNVDQAFRMTTLSLKNGQIVPGLLLREEGQVLVMADSNGKEVRVSKDQVEERTMSSLSPMPLNLVEQIPEKDFYDLLAYLLQQRPPGR